MGEKKFTIGEAVGFGWAATKQYLGFFIIAGIILFVLFGFLDRVAAFLTDRSAGLSLLVRLLSSILNLLVQLGLVKIALKLCDNLKPTIGDLFNCIPQLLYYFIGTMLYGLIVSVGLILLIVPGIIWAIKLQFYPYFILEKGLGPIAALKMSARIAGKVKWHLFLFDLVCMGIITLGVLALLVGIIVAIPVAMLGTAFIYRKLLLQYTAEQTPGPVSA